MGIKAPYTIDLLLAYIYPAVTSSMESFLNWPSSSSDSIEDDIDQTSNNSLSGIQDPSSWQYQYSTDITAGNSNSYLNLLPTTAAKTTRQRYNNYKSQILLPPDDVIAKNLMYKHPSTMPKLSVKLAKESFFGLNTMLNCTVCGQRDHPSLPEAQLYNLKLYLVQLFPLLNRAEFEAKWKDCLISIGQACKTLRSNLKEQLQ